jgi:hypothetical protein
MRIPAILFAALLQGSGPHNSIVLSISARPNPVSLSQSVALVITLTNRSNEPRYVHRALGQPLEFAVRGADAKLVRWFYDAPPPPPIPRDSRDLVRIEGKHSIRCVAEMPLGDLGIRRAGVFSVTGFWQGVSLKAPIDLKDLNFSFSHAETVKLTVTGRKSPANIGLQPTARASSDELSKCASVEAER